MSVYSREQIVSVLSILIIKTVESCIFRIYIWSEEHDYKQGINLNLFAPNIPFIDLDVEHFKSKEELDR
jgi:hypothetical protein